MPRVFIPPTLRPHVGGHDVLDAAGATVGQLLDDIDRRYPGFRDCLCGGESLRPGISVSVGGAIGALGILQRVGPDDEVHFLPAIGGG